ncbi:uncharacterized protein LOC120333998 isoform X2 [Styela clava]
MHTDIGIQRIVVAMAKLCEVFYILLLSSSIYGFEVAKEDIVIVNGASYPETSKSNILLEGDNTTIINSTEVPAINTETTPQATPLTYVQTVTTGVQKTSAIKTQKAGDNVTTNPKPTTMSVFENHTGHATLNPTMTTQRTMNTYNSTIFNNVTKTAPPIAVPVATSVRKTKAKKGRKNPKARRKQKSPKLTPTKLMVKGQKNSTNSGKNIPKPNKSKSVRKGAATCPQTCLGFKTFQRNMNVKLTAMSGLLKELKTGNDQLKESQTAMELKMTIILESLEKLVSEKENRPEWTPWTKWGECSATCGEGTSVRTRKCKGEKRDYCKGKTKETRTCQTGMECGENRFPCDVQYDGSCFHLYKAKRKSYRDIHSVDCQMGKGHLANIYSPEHFELLKELALNQSVIGKYIWTGMTFDIRNRQIFQQDGSRANYLRWMHQFGPKKQKLATGIVLHFDPHEKFRKENNFHVQNGIKNEDPSIKLQYSICEFLDKDEFEGSAMHL